MPPEVHLDPLPIIDGNKLRHQASVKAFTAQDSFSSSMLAELKGSQGGSSKKDDCLITKQDILTIFTPSSPSTLRISISEIKDVRQNTPPEDMLVITISNVSPRSDENCHAELEDALDNVRVSSLDSSITEAHGFTLEAEPIDSESELEVISCHVATGIREETLHLLKWIT